MGVKMTQLEQLPALMAIGHWQAAGNRDCIKIWKRERNITHRVRLSGFLGIFGVGWGFGDVCERKFWGRTRNKRRWRRRLTTRNLTLEGNILQKFSQEKEGNISSKNFIEIKRTVWMFDKLKSQQPFSCGPLHSGKVQRQQAGERGWGGVSMHKFLVSGTSTASKKRFKWKYLIF